MFGVAVRDQGTRVHGTQPSLSRRGRTSTKDKPIKLQQMQQAKLPSQDQWFWAPLFDRCCSIRARNSTPEAYRPSPCGQKSRSEDTHTNASVFFNRHESATLSLGEFEVQANAARHQSGDIVVYSQQELSFPQPSPPTPAPCPGPALPSSVSAPVPPSPTPTSVSAPVPVLEPVSVPPSCVSVPAPPTSDNAEGTSSVTSPPSALNAVVPSWKRKQEECYHLLRSDIKRKRAEIRESEKELAGMMEQEALMKKILDL